MAAKEALEPMIKKGEHPTAPGVEIVVITSVHPEHKVVFGTAEVANNYDGANGLLQTNTGTLVERITTGVAVRGDTSADYGILPSGGLKPRMPRTPTTALKDPLGY